MALGVVGGERTCGAPALNHDVDVWSRICCDVKKAGG